MCLLARRRGRSSLHVVFWCRLKTTYAYNFYVFWSSIYASTVIAQVVWSHPWCLQLSPRLRDRWRWSVKVTIIIQHTRGAWCKIETFIARNHHPWCKLTYWQRQHFLSFSFFYLAVIDSNPPTQIHNVCSMSQFLLTSLPESAPICPECRWKVCREGFVVAACRSLWKFDQAPLSDHSKRKHRKSSDLDCLCHKNHLRTK